MQAATVNTASPVRVWIGREELVDSEKPSGGGRLSDTRHGVPRRNVMPGTQGDAAQGDGASLGGTGLA
jgi:hypothetical protein